jgi:predicted transposase/invertase (TIGR01784 family)
MYEWGEKEQIRLDLEEARTKALTEGHAEGLEKGHAEGHAKGLAEGKLEIAQKMVKLGLPLETVISATQLDPEKVKTLYANEK